MKKLLIILICLSFTVSAFASSQQTSGVLASAIIDRVETRLDDSDNRMYSQGTLLQWLNQGMVDIVTRTHCLETTETINLATDTLEYTVTSTYLTVKGAQYLLSGVAKGLIRGNPMSVGNVEDPAEPVFWYDWNGTLGVYPTMTVTQTLDEVGFGTHVEWDVTSEFDDSGGNAALVFAGGAIGGTLQQVNADQLNVVTASTVYYFSYTVAVTTAPDGDFTLVLTGGAGEIPNTSVTLPYTAGRQTVSFTTHSAAATGDFTITAAETTATQGSITLDDFTLTKEAVNVYLITRPTAIITSAAVTTPAIYDTALVYYMMAQAYMRSNKLGRYLQMTSLYNQELDRLRFDLNEQPKEIIE